MNLSDRTLYAKEATTNAVLKQAASSLNSEPDCPITSAIRTFFSMIK